MPVATSLATRRVTRLHPVAALQAAVVLALLALPNTVGALQFKVDTKVLTFTSGGLQLAGTLYLPRSQRPVAAAVLIHGSGAVDRGTLEYMAKLLSRNGVAALAYDKRGVGKSQGSQFAWRDFSFDDLASDAAAGITLLRGQPGIDSARVGIFAASQGGWVAPLAARLAGGVAFMIVQSASVSTVADDNVFERSARLRSEGFTEAEVEEARHMHVVDNAVSRDGSRADEFARLWAANQSKRWFRRVYVGEKHLGANTAYRLWYRTVMDFDPIPLLRESNAPALWLFGEPALDRFGPVEQSVKAVETLRSTGKDYEVQVFVGADHSLQLASGREAPFRAVVEDFLRRKVSRRAGP